MAQNIAREFLERSIATKQAILNDTGFLASLAKVSEQIINSIRAGGTIYTCGNGGSACDAMHFAEELVARYKRDRKGVRAMHFCDPGVLTCWSNDYSYESAFARQAETFCGPSDVLIAISTSGNSPNILQAVQAAKQKSCRTVALSGKDGGKLKQLADLCLIVPSQETDRIQESHITIIHILCELIEQSLEDS